MTRYQIATDRKEQIRRLKDEGLRPMEIAERLGISRSLVTVYGKDSRQEYFINDRCPITGFKN